MWIAIGILAFGLLVVVVMYNSLVSKKNQAENAFASMDVMLKKRYDLIPNLVAAVKGYAKHEQSVLTEITELRAQAASGKLSTDQTVAVNNLISKALLGVFAVVENYPELKASDNFMQLQRALNEIEEQISAARRAFNAAVTDLNNSVEMFPSNLIAQMTGYQRRQLFEILSTERTNPDVGEQIRKP